MKEPTSEPAESPKDKKDEPTSSDSSSDNSDSSDSEMEHVDDGSLYNQKLLSDDDMTVKEFLDEHKIEVLHFVRFELGEKDSKYSSNPV